MQQSPLFSIIVPVYNAEKWLNDTVASVTSQSNTNWELLLVEDGSSDSSKEIISELAANDGRIKPIFKDNGGVSAARNRGLQEATGQYIIFLDADDMLAEDTLRTYSDIIAQHPEMEIIKASHYVKNFDKFFETRFAKNRTGCEDKTFDGVQLLEKAAWYHCVIYAYCYKASFLKANNLKFIEGASYLEDGAFIVSALRNAKHCYYSPKCTYVYRYQESGTSLSNNISHKKTEGFCKVLALFKADLAASNSATFTHYIDKMLSMHGYYLVRLIMQNPRSERKKLFKQMRSIVGDLPLGEGLANKALLFTYNHLSSLL